MDAREVWTLDRDGERVPNGLYSTLFDSVSTMFGELISLIDVLRSTALDFNGRKLKAEREKVISTLLETYFYLKDATDEGEALVEDAAPNPVKLISSLTPLQAKERLAQWWAVLKRQQFRLRRVSEMIYGQHFIEVVAPDLSKKLYDAIGSKFNRTVSLHGIGSTLFFMDWAESTDAEKANYVSIMAGEKGNLLHIKKIKNEIKELRSAMENFRAAVNTLASQDEILRLSNAARSQTRFSTNSGI